MNIRTLINTNSIHNGEHPHIAEWSDSAIALVGAQLEGQQ